MREIKNFNCFGIVSWEWNKLMIKFKYSFFYIFIENVWIESLNDWYWKKDFKNFVN